MREISNTNNLVDQNNKNICVLCIISHHIVSPDLSRGSSENSIFGYMGTCHLVKDPILLKIDWKLLSLGWRWRGCLEMSSSHVYGEYFKHLGKLRWGTYLRVRCRTENTVDVFKSMSQVVVSRTDRPARRGLLNLRWHRGQHGRQN